MMLVKLDFDQEFFQRPCYRLRPPLSKAEWSEFERLAHREQVFADLKIPASDLATADSALQRGFRKVCTQVELTHPLAHVEPIDDVAFADHLKLAHDQERAHAEHFRASRFRQDPLIPRHIATDLYHAWIVNSLSGGKRVAALGSNFCSFSDGREVRHIDLLSVADKGRGFATRLLKAVAYDAKAANLHEVVVTTEVENEAAIAAYRAAGFDIAAFTSVFHFSN